MRVGKILDYRQIRGALSLYADNLKSVDLSKPIQATLDLLAWGKSGNLILCFSNDVIKFKSSVFYNDEYHSRDKSICFRDIGLCGKKIELLLNRTKSGYINILSGKVLEDE